MSKLIKCKACGQPISKNAKVCPHCGEKNKRIHVGAIVVIIFVAIIIIGITDSGESSTEKTEDAATPIDKELIWNDYKSGNIKDFKEYGLKSEDEWQAIISEGIEKEDRQIVARYLEIIDTGTKEEAYKTIEQEFGVDSLDLDAILAKEADRKAAERKKEVEAAFSPWDGSHRKLTQYIKDNMNDPKSYEHVETRYRDDGDYITVMTTFRGKNSFNATVKNTVTAQCSIDGNVLSITHWE
jgi:predicted nucleic acid-binding Zn ribbon protein